MENKFHFFVNKYKCKMDILVWNKTNAMPLFNNKYMTDKETKNMIWKKGDTMFYKKGVTDPDYCVLKFTATSGRYYCDLKTESFEIK